MQCSALSLEAAGPRRASSPRGTSWLDTECELCGGCLSVCPTGAIYEKFEEARRRAARRAGQGQDHVYVLRRRLPGRPQRRPRAEPDRQGHVRSALPPERGRPLRQGAVRLQLRPPPRPPDRAARSRRGRRAARRPGSTRSRSRPTGLQGVSDRHGPESIGVLSSARLTIEENFLIQKLARTAIGHELGPQLRGDLTRSDSLRPGQVVGQRS